MFSELYVLTIVFYQKKTLRADTAYDLDYTRLRTRTRTVADTTDMYFILLFFLVHFTSAVAQLLLL